MQNVSAARTVPVSGIYVPGTKEEIRGLVRLAVSPDPTPRSVAVHHLGDPAFVEAHESMCNALGAAMNSALRWRRWSEALRLWRLIVEVEDSFVEDFAETRLRLKAINADLDRLRKDAPAIPHKLVTLMRRLRDRLSRYEARLQIEADYAAWADA